MTHKIHINCEIEVTFKMISGKCKPLILFTLINEGTKRFNELRRIISSISQKTLTKQLKELEEDGLITRQAYAEVPLRVEYSVTAKGESLITVFDAMFEWGNTHMDERFELK